ncbi:MAG: LptF/LptG family permease [Bacteroidales bacterium]|nr:LptF/LptG family permease [Bacteroidales bacterium]
MAGLAVEKIRERLHWNILDSYILRKFLGSVVYSITLLMAIIVVVDISENLQRFLDNNASMSAVITGYYLNFIPYFINLFIPLFTFISVIWFTSKLSSHNEIVAILNGGVSFYRMLVPYFAGALIVAAFALVLANFVVPQTNKGLYKFRETYLEHSALARLNIHVKNSPDSYIYLERWTKSEKVGYQFTYEVLGKETIEYKLSAQRIVYNEDTENWTLYGVTERRIEGDRELYSTSTQKDTVFNLTPVDLNQDAFVSETMSTQELTRFIKEEKAKGSTLVDQYIIEQQRRLANPFGTIIMTIFAVSVSSRKTRRGVGVHVFIGMGLAFSFVFFQQISTVFSVQGNMPPGLGTWIPNIICLILCAILLRSTPK